MIEFFEDEQLSHRVMQHIRRFSKQAMKGHIVFSKENKTEAFLLDDDVYKKFKSLDRNPYSMGLFLGMLKDERFVPSLQLLHNIAIADEVRVVISNRAAKSFLYGKDIASKDVIWVLEEVMPGEMVVICNEENEPLGFAETLANGRIMKKLNKEVVLKNVQDIGWYIRGGR